MSKIYAGKIYVKNYELLYTAGYAQSPAVKPPWTHQVHSLLFISFSLLPLSLLSLSLSLPSLSLPISLCPLSHLSPSPLPLSPPSSLPSPPLSPLSFSPPHSSLSPPFFLPLSRSLALSLF